MVFDDAATDMICCYSKGQLKVCYFSFFVLCRKLNIGCSLASIIIFLKTLACLLLYMNLILARNDKPVLKAKVYIVPEQTFGLICSSMPAV